MGAAPIKHHNKLHPIYPTK